MDTESYKVLVQTDDAGRVTAINSDAFVSGDSWTAIDEGEAILICSVSCSVKPAALKSISSILKFLATKL